MFPRGLATFPVRFCLVNRVPSLSTLKREGVKLHPQAPRAAAVGAQRPRPQLLYTDPWTVSECEPDSPASRRRGGQEHGFHPWAAKLGIHRPHFRYECGTGSRRARPSEMNKDPTEELAPLLLYLLNVIHNLPRPVLFLKTLL